jgi:hypothetical protein
MDIKKRRRQVAWICFEPYLSEEQRLQAIAILDRSFQVEGAINIMAYVAKVCMKLGIDLQNHNLLYTQFNQLMSETSELSIADPLLFVDKKVQDFPELESMIIERSASLLVEQEKPAYTLVFATFMGFVLEYIPNRIELFAMLTELVTDKKLHSQDLAGYIMQWIANQNSFAWSDDLDQSTLTRLVHLVYMGLCEVLGPVAADECFHKALAICEQKPEARIFPPSQFL